MTALMGYRAAEELLAAAQERLRELLRPQDLLLPMGDAGFLLLFVGLRSEGHAVLAAERTLQRFESPLRVMERWLTPVVALGLATCPTHASDAEALSLQALGALDSALQQGRRWAMASMDPSDLLLHDDLREALQHNQLTVAFQPVIDLATGRWHAVESLARWNCPRRGSVAPSHFVSLAEQTGLAHELTRWSIHASLREFAPLRVRVPDLQCAINLSPKVFTESGLVEHIHSALAIWDLPAQALIIEVTETAVMENPEFSAQALRRLRESGIGIALDDFGQGYSSFNYLQHFPAQNLKIDQCFVTGMATDPRSQQLVRAIIELAHHLDLTVVAEGVEDAEVLDLLRAMNCDHAQGFHLGRPSPAAQLLSELSP